MNFKTALSSGKGLIFIYQSGDIKKTDFIEVSYYGDDYLLAKTEHEIFYRLLDLDGNIIENDCKVLYRFYNGMLLTFRNNEQVIESSDKLTYRLCYNIYGIFNFDMGTHCAINVFHQDDFLLENSLLNNSINFIEKKILNKQLLQFKNFTFSDIIGERYILCCNSTLLKVADSPFDTIKNKQVWEVADVFNATNNNNPIFTNNIITGKTFKEAEAKLVRLVEQEKRAGIDENNLNIKFDVFKSLTKTNWWHALANLLGSKTN